MDSNDYIEFEGVRRYQPDALHKRMLQRIAELERQGEAREAALIEQVDYVIELQAQLRGQLVQVDEDEDLFDPVNQVVISTMYSGTAFLLDCIEEPIHLPAGYYIAKVQPAE